MKLLFAIIVTSFSMLVFGNLESSQKTEIPVSSFIEGEITDVDDGALQGIAVLRAASGIEYTTNAGTTWRTMPTGGNGKAVLLAPNNRLRFESTAQQGQRSPWIEFLAWDRTSGSIGQTITLSQTGGETAFSDTYLPVVFLIRAAAVDEDMQLPIRVQAFTSTNNIGILTDVVYNIEPPEMGTWKNRVTTDPPNVAGYFVPSGTLGVCTLVVSGKNKRGEAVTPGTLEIEVVAGAAKVIVVEALPQVSRDGG